MAASVAVKRLENITECAICAGDLTDARVLPCLHTFCLKCIEKWSQNKQPGDKISCPMCREEFEISEGGIAALPKNGFVDKLLEVKKLSSTLAHGEIMCDVCRDDNGKSGEKVMRKAAVYCVDCRHNICELCHGHHQKFRLSGVHKVVELNSEMSEDELLLKFPVNFCDKHHGEHLKIYCIDCKVAVCTMCYITSHNSHKYSDVKDVTEDLIKQMSVNVEKLTAKVTECKTVLKNIEDNENAFCNSVAETEKMICERAEKLKQLIDDHKQSLLEQLSVSKDKQLKHTGNLCEEIEKHQIMLENFIRYSSEVKTKGTACDIAKLANELDARSKELQEFVIHEVFNYNVTEVHFASPEAEDDIKSVYGNLVVDTREYFKISGEVFGILPSKGTSVTGIDMLSDKLYVSRWGVKQATIYSPATFQEQTSFNLAGSMQGAQGTDLRNIAACDVNNCIYATDQSNHYMYKADCQNNYTNSQWSVGGNPHGLSVTTSQNVLVALQAGHSLREYSTDGNMIRQINLQPAGITSPVHAVQLSQNRYAITHHDPKHQLSIVDSDGKLVQSYGGGAGNLNAPYGITVDKRGLRMFVADMSNNRILVISCKTLEAYPLPLPDCELNGPYCLHYDTANDRLYIGEWNGQRIICCKMLLDRA